MQYIVLGAAAFTVTPERAGFINFTEVIEREAYAFMVNRPAELSRVSLFADPFSIEVSFIDQPFKKSKLALCNLANFMISWKRCGSASLQLL